MAPREVGVRTERRQGVEDARRRVLREPLQDGVPGLGDARPDGLVADTIGQQRGYDAEPVLGAHLGEGQLERAQAEVHVGETGQRAERAHLLLWRRCRPVALQQCVVVAGTHELGDDGQDRRLDVGRDRGARAPADRRCVEAPGRLLPDPGVRADGAHEVDGQGAQRGRAFALVGGRIEAEVAEGGAEQRGHRSVDRILVLGQRNPVGQHERTADGRPGCRIGLQAQS